MTPENFKPGDEVMLSATFLRSVGRNYSLIPGQMGLTPDDKGVGVIIGFAPDAPMLAFVQWEREPGIARAINTFNLIHRKNAHFDAMSAERTIK